MLVNRRKVFRIRAIVTRAPRRFKVKVESERCYVCVRERYNCGWFGGGVWSTTPVRRLASRPRVRETGYHAADQIAFILCTGGRC